MSRRFRNFSEFYPFYLSQHKHPNCRRLHFVGTALSIFTLLLALASRRWELLWLLPVVGYGFAWLGHLIFEKNRPATFTHPFYSLLGDFLMFAQILTGRLRLPE
ncbi:MAG: DUF962 domain-containing protein [Gammaproteobacteria bacterium]|nr:DUF962 domain-containing protein [Gammaproteobacteria bacterium]